MSGGKLLSKVFKPILLILLVFLLLGVGKELASFYVRDVLKISFTVKGANWDFRAGELSLSADFVEVESPKFRFLAEDGRVSLDVPESVRNAKLFFREVSGLRVLIETEGEGEKGGKKFPLSLLKRVYVENLSVGSFTFERGKSVSVRARLVEKRGSDFFFGGLVANINGKRVEVYPFSGVLGENSLRVNGAEGVYGDNLRFKLSLDFGSLSPLRGGGVALVDGGESLNLSATINVCGSRFGGRLEGKVGNRDLNLFSRGSFDGGGVRLFSEGSFGYAKVKLSSFYEGEEGEVKGEIFSPSESYGSAAVSNLKGNFHLRFPSLSGSGRFEAERVEIYGVPLGRSFLSLRFGGERVVGEFVSSGEALKVDFKAPIEGGFRKVEAAVSLQGFKVEKGGLSATLFGGGRVFYEKGGSLSYDFSVRGAPLKFDRLLGRGELAVKGEGGRADFTYSVSSANGGILRGVGSLRERKFSADFSFEKFDSSLFSVLEKLGVAGVFSGSGQISGRLDSLKSIDANISFSGKGAEFRGLKVSDVLGEFSYSGGEVLLNVSSREVLVEKLVYRVADKKLSLKGYAYTLSGEEIWSLLKSFRVSLPFSVYGSVSGGFSLSLPLADPKEVKLKLSSISLNGVFSLKDLLWVGGSFGGEVVYEGGYMEGGFFGELEEGSLKGKRIEGGLCSVSLFGKSVGVSYSSVSLPDFFAVSSGFLALSLGEERSVSGNLLFSSSVEREGVGRVEGIVEAALSGSLSEITVKISGNGKVKSQFLAEKEERAEINGKLELPEGVGLVQIKSKSSDVKLIFNEGGEIFTTGKIRNLKVKSEKAEVLIRVGMLNLKLNELSGNLYIPAVEIKPMNFYRLFSPGGIYVEIDRGKVKISDFSLSYVDGWIDVKSLSIKPLGAEIVAELGLKGLIYLSPLKREFPVVGGIARVWGRFVSGVDHNFTVKINGAQLKSKHILDKIQIQKLDAKVKKGSPPVVRGEILTREGSVILDTKEGGKLLITISQIPIGEIEKWKSFVSGNLTYSFREKKLLGSLELDRTKLLFKKEEEKGEETGEQTTLKLPFRANVELVFSEPVKIKSELFWIELLPHFTFYSGSEGVKIFGNFYATGGEINYMGKVFKVISGSGTVEDLITKRGRVSIVASTLVSGYYVYMKIEGNLSSPRIILTSDPPLGREEILNLIMTGATPEQIETSSELFPAVQIAYYAASEILKPIESKFQEALGLESLSVEPYITRYGETVAKLTITKKLSERIRLSGYGTTGQNPEYGASLDFFISDKYYLEVRFDSHYGVEVGPGFEVRIR